MLALVAAWGLRLGIHILVRNHGLPEDPRYADLLADAGPLVIVRKVQVPQGLTMWVVSLPAQVAMVLLGPVWALVVAGALMWLVGFAFEAVGDAQLAAFKRDPANRGRVMQSGLWRYTRHPNYFGEATMWWGICVIVSWHWLGLAVGLLSAGLISWLLVAKTGKALTERRLADSKPDYRAYVQRTSGFIPLPPKRA
jgi:steroid 5-alpha reductase family enzyme